MLHYHNTNLVHRVAKNKKKQIQKDIERTEQEKEEILKHSDSENILIQKIKTIQYNPIFQAISQIIGKNSNVENPDFSAMLKFSTSYTHLCFAGVGQFYLESYQTNSAQISFRNKYIWGNHEFYGHNLNVLEIISALLSKKSEREIQHWLINYISNMAATVGARRSNFNDIQKVNALKANIQDFYNLFILPHKEKLKSLKNLESSSQLKKHIWVFLFLDEKNLEDVVDCFIMPEHRVIEEEFIIIDHNGHLVNYEYLLKNYSGWDSFKILKLINPIEKNTNISIFKKVIESIDVTKHYDNFLSARKSFVKNNMDEHFFIYYINTLCGGINAETLNTIATVVNKGIVDLKKLENNNFGFIDYIKNNREIIKNDDIKNIIISESIFIELNEKELEQMFHQLVVKFNQNETFNKFFETFYPEQEKKDVIQKLMPFILNNNDIIYSIQDKYMFAIDALPEDSLIEIVRTNMKPDNDFKKNKFIFNMIARFLRKSNLSDAQKDAFNGSISKTFIENKWFEKPLETLNAISGQQGNDDYVEKYMTILNKHIHFFNTMDIPFNMQKYSYPSSVHKNFFNYFVSTLNLYERDDFYEKYVINMKENHPIHKMLDNMLNFFSVENSVSDAISSKELKENSHFVASLKLLLEIIRKMFGLSFLQQHDSENISIAQKLRALGHLINIPYTNSNVDYDSIDVSEYCLNEEESLKRKFMFWKKTEAREEYTYLYILPQGPLMSNNILPEFISNDEIQEDESWKPNHEAKTKEIYSILQTGNFSVEISLQSKDIIRNFKKISENLEPVRQDLDFEEQMFFEKTFFNDLLEMLNTHNKTMNSIKALNKIEVDGASNLSEKSENNCLRILNMLQQQMDNISNDIIKNMIHKSNFDLDVLVEYVRSRKFNNGKEN